MDFSKVCFDDQGLIPVIVQNSSSKEVLMLAYANRQALEETEKTGEMYFWSRSRQKLWHKGETSGNTMRVAGLSLDCDGDTILAEVEPAGPACHTGARTCFFRSLLENTIYSAPHKYTVHFLEKLWVYLTERQHHDPSESYTAQLIQSGKKRTAQKVGEEGVETALAIAAGDTEEVIYEAADLIYHLMVGLLSAHVSFWDVVEELKRRHKAA
jgi:phosphoribosyl-ATP pyrophosphohydrolase/phosphoribosyl-AMP cyclohydrolase